MAFAPAAAAGRWDRLATTVFRNYGRDQGLPHPVPTALAQDHQGFIWIGTQGGLARWDGYRFHTYRTDPGVQGSLPDDWIQTLHVDQAGRLWVGGGGGGLARYDAARDRFVPVRLAPSVGRTHIGAIADDGRGGLWIGRQDNLHHLDPATGAVTTSRAGKGQAPGLPEGSIEAILRDRHGNLWVGTTQALAYRPANAAAFLPVSGGDKLGGVSALFEDDEGRIWIGTPQRGLFVIERDAAPQPVEPAAPDAVSRISAICAAGPHSIWVGVRGGGGVMVVDTRTRRVHTIHHERTIANSLAHDDIWTVMRDRAGSLWAGGTGGLSYAPHTTGLITTILGASDRPGGLSGTDILSTLATRSGQVWVGYLNGGADRIDPVTGAVLSLRTDRDRGGGTLPPDALASMAEADDGTVYFATRRGLYGLPPGQVTPRPIAIPGRLPQASTSALTYDAGILWVGGELDGLWGFVPGTPGRVVFGPRDSTRLSDPAVNVIRRGPGPFLWVGTRNGLERVNLATHKIDHILAQPADPRALPGRNVVALLFDRKDRLWVATFGGGLALMTGQGADGLPRFRRFGTAEHLPHLNVDSLQMDGTGTIWAGTDDGLARIDPETLTIRPVRRADGSFLIDYMAGGGATSPAGEALFGALGGLTVVRPGVLPPWRLRPPVVVTEIRVGEHPIPIEPFNAAGTPKILDIQPDADSLSVEFAALDFTAPERNRYAYRLDGFDKNWIETDANRRLASYTNLPPGDYTLRLRGTNRDGLWTGQDRVLTIHVLPAWYQRLWFKLFVAVLALFAVAGLVRWRTAYLRGRQAELERQIAERTADLRAANERLGQLATTDPLTDCANRWHFIERARELINLGGEVGGPISLIIFDLDQFKQVNDSFGHPVGDAVLTKTGRILAEHARPVDLIGRMGGEEFALLMPHVAGAVARDFAEQLREAIGASAIDLYGESIRVTASLGITEMRPGEDFDTLYARADAALYAAKNKGRNRVELVD
jgi:diguanylate cyclase (GGDEF)-like protein